MGSGSTLMSWTGVRRAPGLSGSVTAMMGVCVYLLFEESLELVGTWEVIVRMTSRNDYYETQGGSSTRDDTAAIQNSIPISTRTMTGRLQSQGSSIINTQKGITKKEKHPIPHHPLPPLAPAPNTPSPSPLQQTPHTPPALSGCAP